MSRPSRLERWLWVALVVIALSAINGHLDKQDRESTKEFYNERVAK